MRFIIILAVTFFSCNNNPKSTTESKEQTKENTHKLPITDKNECYWQTNNRDTLVATLKQEGSNVSGKLIFDNYEKDGSTGTVTGIAEGDILKLWYTFQSEGLQSVMQVWFKQDGDKIIRGIGPTTEKGDSSYFTNPSEIEFTGSTLQKVDCDKISSQK